MEHTGDEVAVYTLRKAEADEAASWQEVDRAEIPDCSGKVVRRRGVVYVICSDPRHKQRQG